MTFFSSATNSPEFCLKFRCVLMPRYKLTVSHLNHVTCFYDIDGEPLKQHNTLLHHVIVILPVFVPLVAKTAQHPRGFNSYGSRCVFQIFGF